jgi:hypothetical protein
MFTASFKANLKQTVSSSQKARAICGKTFPVRTATLNDVLDRSDIYFQQFAAERTGCQERQASHQRASRIYISPLVIR